MSYYECAHCDEPAILCDDCANAASYHPRNQIQYCERTDRLLDGHLSPLTNREVFEIIQNWRCSGVV